MRKFIAGLLGIGLIAALGCDTRGTPGGGGSPASPTKRPVVGTADETFTLSMPTLGTTIKQGETKVVSIGIRRGDNFGEDVALKFGEMPKGVTIEPKSPSIKHGEKEAKISVKAADDAALGDFKIKVTGHPTKGANAENELKLTVEKK